MKDIDTEKVMKQSTPLLALVMFTLLDWYGLQIFFNHILNASYDSLTGTYIIDFHRKAFFFQASFVKSLILFMFAMYFADRFYQEQREAEANN